MTSVFWRYFTLAALLVGLTSVADAGELPQRTILSDHLSDHLSDRPASNSSLAKAAVDTIDLMGPEGSGAPYIGDFESGWNGWTSIDYTRPTVSHWQVSDYNQAVAGNLAAWCGDAGIASCNDSLDPIGGYGNNWHDLLGYRVSVADPAASATVNVAATLQHDTEPGYDYVRLSAKIAGNLGYTDLQSWDQIGIVPVANGITYLPAELVDGSDVHVLFRFVSDGGWSDEDCSWPTAGACQVDDITVTVSQAGQPDIVSFSDFQDGTFGDWATDFPQGVGDFAALWSGLRTIDPCTVNFTQQVAFIDDGVVVPGTGGSDCINWCYGPAGFIVNTTGGLAGPQEHINNYVLSPEMAWPAGGYDGARLTLTVYEHEDLSADAPGVFWTWGVRSADTDGSEGNGVQQIADQEWRDRNFVYYGMGGTRRSYWDVGDLMNPGRDVVQIQSGAYELGWAWGWNGNDGYPAPYIDNVSFKVYPYAGPSMQVREIDLAQDNFPEVDAINFADLGSLHVRFDMARSKALAADLCNCPGDSIVFDITPIRTGAQLVGDPQMHYVIDANPVFDPYRTTPTAGIVDGRWAIRNGATEPPFDWAFDLPDTGTLFPGDVLHYYIRAADDLAGDIQHATLPVDLTGFGDFSHPLAYNSTYTVHALPTISADGFGGYEVPPILFWNDNANRGGEEEWYGALDNLGLRAGVDYDIYYTNGPSSGVGNGVGGRTSGLALEHYDELLYTAGSLGISTLSNGDFDRDAGDDIGALINWMSGGNKDLFLTGDDLASDLWINAGTAGDAFVEGVMGLNTSSNDLRSFIGNQTTPLVLAVAGNPVFPNVSNWIAFGGCFGINTFDAVTPRASAVRLAEFADPNGLPGAYGFSAATLNIYNTTNRVVSLPYDLMYVYTNPGEKVAAPLSARAQILGDVLDFFGVVSSALPSPVPGARQFAVSNSPNPFNPATRIAYTVKAPGHLSLKVYDVRGALVKTLVDGQVAADGFVMWDGTDSSGGGVSSGVYFTEARMGGEVQVQKMALVK